jgi:hypothetical protein
MFEAYWLDKYLKDNPGEKDPRLTPLQPLGTTPPLPDRKPLPERDEDEEDGMDIPPPPPPPRPGDDTFRQFWQQQDNPQQRPPVVIPPPPPSRNAPMGTGGYRIEASLAPGLIDPSALMGGGGTGLLGGAGEDQLRMNPGIGPGQAYGPPKVPEEFINPTPEYRMENQWVPPGGGGAPSYRLEDKWTGGGAPTAGGLPPTDLPSMMERPLEPDLTTLPGLLPGGEDAILGGDSTDVVGGGRQGVDFTGGAPRDTGENPGFFSRMFGGANSDKLGAALMNIGGGMIEASGDVEGGGTRGLGRGFAAGNQAIEQINQQEKEDAYRKHVLALKERELDVPDYTDDQKEFHQAQLEGFKGTFTDYMVMMRRAGAINMGDNGASYGSPGENMQWARDANGKILTQEIEGRPGAYEPVAIPTPGGKIAEASRREGESRAATYMVVDDSVDTAINDVTNKPGVAGFFGGVLKNFDGTAATDLSGTLDTIEGNIAIDKITDMRRSSPNGAALGNATDADVRMLKSAFGSLKQNQSPQQLKENLVRFKKIWNQVVWKGKPPKSVLKETKTRKTQSGVEYEIEEDSE